MPAALQGAGACSTSWCWRRTSMPGASCARTMGCRGRRPRRWSALSSKRSWRRRRAMARFLWLNWSGGGNLPPSLGVARILRERGHEVAFAGRPEMVPRVKTAGFRAIEITQAYSQLDGYPTGSHLTRMACYLTSPAVESQVRSIVDDEAPDA